MMGHNIHFKGVIWKIIPKLFLLPLLIFSTGAIQISCHNIWFFGNNKKNTEKSLCGAEETLSILH